MPIRCDPYVNDLPLSTGNPMPVALVSGPGGSAPAKTSISGTITAGGVAQTLQGANASRLGFEIMNVSTDELWFNELGGTAIVGQPSFRLLPGDYYSGNTPSALSIIGPTTGQAFVGRTW